MAKVETDVVNQIKIALAPLGVVLLKNVRGLFLTLDGKRKVRAGLEMNGSGDLIGWTEIIVTPDLIGKKLAIFTSFEVKADTQPSADQLKFARIVRERGGYAGIVKNIDDAKKITKK